MLALELSFAIALVAAACISATVFLSSCRKSENQVKGPQNTKHDPFNVTKPLDLVDGFPINPDAFWRRTRFKKLLIAIVLAASVSIGTVSLTWSALVSGKADPVQILHVVFSVYVFLLSVRAVKQIAMPEHTQSMFHLASLTTLATFLLAIVAILPPPTAPAPAATSVPALSVLGYLPLATNAVAAIMTLTMPLGPDLHYPPEAIYFAKTIAAAANIDQVNVAGITVCSIWDTLLFSYTTKVVWLGNIATSLEIADLPILPASMRATVNYTKMKRAIARARGMFTGSGWMLIGQLMRVNAPPLLLEIAIAVVCAVLYYIPAFFTRSLVAYLERDPERKDIRWGLVFCVGLFVSNASMYLLTGQLWSIATTIVQVRVKIQLNSVLFQKTLVRKDIAGSAAASSSADADRKKPAVEESVKKDEANEGDFSSKAQIMTLMTVDVDRVSEFAWHLFALIDSPIEIIIGTWFLYSLLGSSCFVGLATTILFLPVNHFAGSVVVGAQDNLMKSRDERVALMNEILGGIRMIKFMAWERSFEKRVLKIREKELKYQRLNYLIEVLFNTIWNGSPIIVTLMSFWHFAIYRGQPLTPSVAFTSILVFNEMRFALNALPETFINMLQSLVSLKRIEKYLNGAEVKAVPALAQQEQTIALRSCTITWPQDRSGSSSAPSLAGTPRHKFVLQDLSLQFPEGELSLICGKLGAGKTLLLLALMGEADVLTGQLVCPRSPPDVLASFAEGGAPKPADWVVKGVCAYVPQAAWLRNASIKENILFDLPYDEERYHKTLEVCALLSDLEILEDGDESEIGERGVNLSGGQKARVSLARAVYSRASVLLLDDVLSAVDAHTAYHLYHQCLQGDIMKGRTVLLVSHHVQLCTPGAAYIVALDNGRLLYSGARDGFQSSGVMGGLVQSVETAKEDEKEEKVIEEADVPLKTDSASSSAGSSATVAATPAKARKPPRKLVEDEKRAVGHISRDIWETYVTACGRFWYWILFAFILLLAALSPVAENGWLRYWSNSQLTGEQSGSPMYYIGVYALITVTGQIVIANVRWFVLYDGAIRASHVLHKRLLEAVLFAHIRFHDTVSRGRVLNRFGKDFEGIDSNLSDNFGRTIAYTLSSIVTFVTIIYVGGPVFLLAIVILGYFFYSVGKVYGQTSRDMRRLDSVTRSPLYSIYGETIAGVAIIRSFGASSKFLRDMLRYVDTNISPYYWMWGVNRWLSVRFNVLSAAVVGVAGLVALLTPRIDASFAGFLITFASSVTHDLLFTVRRFVGLEQSLVALERVKEYSEIPREPPEFIEPRPPAAWPYSGTVQCENLVIRYAPELPPVLHHLNFNIKPGEKVGILGRTGSGKSTLALSFFRFVEPTEGRIIVDGLDISKIGLTDLRSRLTIIPQDPTILSGTLRSTLDVFDEYDDADIYEALRRVHLLPPVDAPVEDPEEQNANVFRNLEGSVSEGGENFSTGEKQLLCMARALLKHSKILVMDEATASVDYATDELIGKTIRQEFAGSTILTIAHRLRTVIDYDRVMLLDQGRIAEFDSPNVLLNDSSSMFYQLCQATGKDEFATLKKMAGR
ncbi:multidrug resistance-associated ABC transporter [Fistulina hepatica ATCC 64428]|uniref:Multidrug resistance-associated ABC transporter n=1 Tax=Fistulina hepatica ATCC 64428 TaxID=1128425 RepID=A0A0D7APT2_9AGAR|nr:multidrug resistance-associated ABC transporter [Fistulina hepatica ATCC 64428]